MVQMRLAIVEERHAHSGRVDQSGRFVEPKRMEQVLVNRFMQYRLVLASHEAVDKNLFHPLWFNETAGLVCASAVGVSLFNYRKAHLDHHKAPQSIQDDIDGYIYRPLLKARPGWPRLFLLVSGNYVD